MTPSRLLPQFPYVSHLKASEIQIVTQLGDEYDYMSEIPRQAIVSDGTARYFKPSLDKSQVIREIDVQSRILNAGLKGKIRVANVHSIVISDDAMMTIGLLFDLTHSFVESLDSFQCKTATEHHAKWKQQVTDIITELHSHDIVWGDVHPGNIFIDKNFDAWVVDFGGGWVEEFVHSDKAGTKATGKGSGEYLTNGFLEMKTPDDTVALLVSMK
jgi:tRNA A-37 threonylcarbamoyl transferase component Bud32